MPAEERFSVKAEVMVQSVCVVSVTMMHHLPCAKVLHSHTYSQDKFRRAQHTFLLRVFEHVDACKDLECRSQFNVHGAHEVVLL